MPNGELVSRDKGTPQGGVVSPVLSNLFLHYVFDKWLKNHYPNTPWCRYADDGLVHCRSEAEAQHMLAVLKQRFRSCGLELHPVKTKIVTVKMEAAKGTMSIHPLIFWGIRSDGDFVGIAKETVCL